MRFNKKFLHRTIFFTPLLILLLLAVSCSKDKEPDDPSGNLPAELANNFVGAWESSTGSQTFVFFNDGYAKLNGKYFGKWTYNKDTNILATTVNNFQFQITLTSNDEWAAIGISSNKTYSFKRITGANLAYAILNGATVVDLDNKDGEYKCSINDRAFSFDVIVGFPGMKYVKFNEDGGEYSYIGYNEYYNSFCRGKADFKNIYSASECNLKLKDSLGYLIDNRGK